MCHIISTIEVYILDIFYSIGYVFFLYPTLSPKKVPICTYTSSLRTGTISFLCRFYRIKWLFGWNGVCHIWISIQRMCTCMIGHVRFIDLRLQMHFISFSSKVIVKFVAKSERELLSTGVHYIWRKTKKDSFSVWKRLLETLCRMSRMLHHSQWRYLLQESVSWNVQWFFFGFRNTCIPWENRHGSTNE